MPVKPCFMHTVNENMSKLGKNNAKCEIFARYAEINSTDRIDKQSILSLFHNTCKNKIRDFMGESTFYFIKLHV